MTQPIRLPLHLQPQPKAVSTVSSTSPSVASTPPHQPSRPTSLSRPSSPAARTRPTKIADKALASFIRRVLCPNSYTSTGEARPLSKLLPPLTSSNEVDLQLYAIIAIVINDAVQSWYGKITNDQAFVEEAIAVIAHCTRAIEERLRSVDLEALVFDEIPRIIECHINGTLSIVQCLFYTEYDW